VSLALLACTDLASTTVAGPASTDDAVAGPPAHTFGTLAAQLNLEWAGLAFSPSSAAAAERWGRSCPVLAGASSPEDLRARVAGPDVAARDAVLLALLELAQAGDVLAGRTVLQAMLGKAVRVAASAARRAEFGGDQQEALSCAVAALWQVIATYPVAGRPSRVAANLALDTLALVQRGHTGSSLRRRAVPEVPTADVRTVAKDGHLEQAAPEPADAELYTLLAWAVRCRVMALPEARLLVRVYGVDAHGWPVDVRAIAAQEGISRPALRQRCHRLARRLGAAALAAGVGADGLCGDPLLAVA
jgi:hypothetical protein